jgi:hypothetical protein
MTKPYMQIIGTLVFRDNRVYVKNEACVEIDLFSWLASYGLRNQDVNIIVEKIREKK